MKTLEELLQDWGVKVTHSTAPKNLQKREKKRMTAWSICCMI